MSRLCKLHNGKEVRCGGDLEAGAYQGVNVGRIIENPKKTR